MFDWNFLVFVGALRVAAFSHGPGLAALIATVLDNGARQAIWFCVGIILGDLAWLTLSLNGLALIALQIPFVFFVIKWAAFCIWSTLRPKIGGHRLRYTICCRAKERGSIARIVSGFWVTMGSPKIMLFHLTLLPSIVTPEAYHSQ